jgi:hypothetical protein
VKGDQIAFFSGFPGISFRLHSRAEAHSRRTKKKLGIKKKNPSTRLKKKNRRIKRTPYGAMTSNFLDSDNDINGFYIKLIISPSPSSPAQALPVDDGWLFGAWLCFRNRLGAHQEQQSEVKIALGRNSAEARWHYRKTCSSWSDETRRQVPVRPFLAFLSFAFDKWQLKFDFCRKVEHTRA